MSSGWKEWFTSSSGQAINWENLGKATAGSLFMAMVFGGAKVLEAIGDALATLSGWIGGFFSETSQLLFFGLGQALFLAWNLGAAALSALGPFQGPVAMFVVGGFLYALMKFEVI